MLMGMVLKTPLQFGGGPNEVHPSVRRSSKPGAEGLTGCKRMCLARMDPQINCPSGHSPVLHTPPLVQLDSIGGQPPHWVSRVKGLGSNGVQWTSNQLQPSLAHPSPLQLDSNETLATSIFYETVGCVRNLIYTGLHSHSVHDISSNMI